MISLIETGERLVIKSITDRVIVFNRVDLPMTKSLENSESKFQVMIARRASVHDIATGLPFAAPLGE